MKATFIKKKKGTKVECHEIVAAAEVMNPEGFKLYHPLIFVLRQALKVAYSTLTTKTISRN